MKVSQMTVDQLEKIISKAVEDAVKKDANDLVTITRAAEQLGIRRSRIANAATCNRLPYKKDGGIHLISLEVTKLYMQKRRVEAKARWEQMYGEFTPEQ